MTIEQQTSASASFVASAPCQHRYRRPECGHWQQRQLPVATSTIQVRLGTVNRGSFMAKGLPAARRSAFDSGLLSDADRRAHRLFGVSVESDTPALSQGQQQRQRRRREADLRQ